MTTEQKLNIFDCAFERFCINQDPVTPDEYEILLALSQFTGVYGRFRKVVNTTWGEQHASCLALWVWQCCGFSTFTYKK